MAEDFREFDASGDDLTAARDALIAECKREEENCLYTSTSFFIWLRRVKLIRAVLWAGGALGSVVSAGGILEGGYNFPVVLAMCALAGVLMPGLIKALQLDAAIQRYEAAAGEFKNLQGEFRRAANVWAKKSFTEFETEARKAFASMNEARKASLTPPEWCFRAAQKKIKSGDYNSDKDPAW